MRIACVDKTAADRVLLEKYVADAFQACRESVGHIPVLQTLPASREEVLINTPPDGVLLGPRWHLEESFALAKELSYIHPGISVFVVLSPENYSLRALKRFESISIEVFCSSEAQIRVVHRLMSVPKTGSTQEAGQMVTISGVKGGVGASSIVSGLGHAAQALGQRVLLVDLSASSVLAHYLLSERWQSPDYAALLLDKLIADDSVVSRCLHSTPNGLCILLPPTGGSEMREMWLRDVNRLETSLSLIEGLRQKFDLIIVDIAGAEGVLPFALQCRAENRILLSSNDPASVHLLATELENFRDIPGDGAIRILLSMLAPDGLGKEDIIDFLYSHSAFNPESCIDELVGFDRKAKNWVGTGNSFYTEGRKSTKESLEIIAKELIWGERQEKLKSSNRLQKFLTLINLYRQPRLSPEHSPGLLPLLTPTERSVLSAADVNAHTEPLTEENHTALLTSVMIERPSPVVAWPSSIVSAAVTEDQPLYEPPKLQVNQ